MKPSPLSGSFCIIKDSQARQIYEKLLVEVSSKYNPNEVHRLELIDRLEAIDELKDGETEVSEREKRIVLINTPECEIYVSVGGKDTGKGTKESPFATIGRAQEEVRKIKKEKGLPQKGVVVYLRKGEYFIDDTIIFTEEDSGTENAPVIYRSFSEESVRIIGGKRISNFKPLNDPLITERLPREANGRVWVADLKEAGITEYGTIKNRGTGTAQTGAMELIYNGKVMQMARWPNEGWTRVASLVNPKGDYFFRNEPYQRGKFKYSGDRPARWTEEKDIWIWGYLGPKVPYVVNHLNISSIDTANKTIYTKEDPRWTHVKDPAYIGDRISKNTPYFVFNVLSEIDIPGEYYLDRETGKIYFYPPDNMKGEAIVTTLNKPIIEFKNASNIVLYKITAEGAWQDAILVSGGEKNLIAGCTVRNIGQNGIYIESGWNHGIVGCDICDVGEGAVKLVNYRLYGHGFTPSAENRRKLIPNGCYIENTFISRVNRLTGNSIAVSVSGIGQRVSHNLITDSSHSAMDFTCNNNIIEYNEIHDVVAHSREVGAIYTWDIGQPLTYRGNILKNNFLHHVTGHYSPNFTHGASAVHIDGLSSNITISGNILYRTNAISSSAPDCRFENNTFVDCFPGLSLGNRGSIIESDGKLNKAGYTLFTVFKNFGYNTPPWSVRYPELSDIFNPKKRPIGWPRNITVERNISSGGALVQFGAGVRTGNTVTDNIDGQDPFFYNKKSLDFRVRPGSPVYGQIGFEPVDFQKIGLYNDPLRASWPVNREIGKYYDLTKETAEIKQKKYDVIRRTAPIKIDGKLDKNEWMGLDRSKAIVIDKYYRKTQEEASCKSYTWIMYDDEYLYIGVEHEPDPWTEEMPVTLKDLPIDWGMVEVSVEGKVIDETSSWWLPDMETGPIYIFTGFPNGNLKILDSYFKIPASLKAELAKKSQYASVMHDISTYKWSAEFKIPLDILNIKPSEVDSTRFNIGARKRKDWIGWAYTIGPIWRLEGGGQIRFIK